MITYFCKKSTDVIVPKKKSTTRRNNLQDESIFFVIDIWWKRPALKGNRQQATSKADDGRIKECNCQTSTRVKE